MRSLLAVAGTLIVIFAIRIAAPVVAPLCLAAVLAIAFEPVTRGLARRGIPRWCAAVATNLVILAVVAGVAALVLGAASEIIDGLPRYSEALGALEHDVAAWLDTHGLDSVATSMGEVDAASRLPVVAEPVLRGTIDIIQTLILVIIVTAFIQVDAPGLRRTFARRVDTRASTRDVDDVVDRIQRYVIVKGLISAANGLLLGLWCHLWGVEGAVLWGVLAFALNFIPIVGSLIAAIPPVALALVLGSPADAAGVAAGYIAVNLVVDNIIEPRVMGRAAGLSPLVVLVAMLFWGFVLGPIGALLSVPLTVVLRAGLAMSPGLRWIALLLDDDATVTATTTTDLGQSRERSSRRRYNDRRSIPSTLAA
ncbi:MAG TPA: AI-2E family transporter [Kofleriaceae bacterium]|nr:AI-2E family transporter [Kofleriaceae bacterium]